MKMKNLETVNKFTGTGVENLPDEDVRSSAVSFLTFLTSTSSPQLAIVHGLYGRLFSFVG